MKSFSDVYNEYFALSKYDLAKKMFEAGQQSKQAEVDELRFQRDVLSSKVNDLQKRIDDLENKNKRLGMRLDVIQGVMQKEVDLIAQLKGE